MVAVAVGRLDVPDVETHVRQDAAVGPAVSHAVGELGTGAVPNTLHEVRVARDLGIAGPRARLHAGFVVVAPDTERDPESYRRRHPASVQQFGDVVGGQQSREDAPRATP